MAAGALWGKGTEHQGLISSVRESFSIIGFFLAALLPAILLQSSNRTHAYTWLCVILLVFTCISLVAYRFFSARNPAKKEPWAQVSFSYLWLKAAQKKRFFLIYFVSALAASMPAILLIFYVRDVLQSESWLGAFLATYFASGIAAMPLWLWISRRTGKLKSWFYSMLSACVAFVWAYYLSAGDHTAFLIICAFSGAAFGASLALPPAILAEHMTEHETAQTSQFSLLAFLLKAAFAMASGITLPLLDYAGYSPNGTNSANAQHAIQTIYALIPCIIQMAAALILWKYMKETKNETLDMGSVARGLYR